jgi:hypothetical protein
VAAGGVADAGGETWPEPSAGVVVVAVVVAPVVAVSVGRVGVVPVGIVRSGDVLGTFVESSSSAPHALKPALRATAARRARGR